MGSRCNVLYNAKQSKRLGLHNERPAEPAAGLVYLLKRRQFFVSCALATEWLGLEDLTDGVWSVYFTDCLLARLDERDFKLRG